MEALQLFLSSIRSPETRTNYFKYFKRYQQFLARENLDLFFSKDPKIIADKIIEYLVDMQKQGRGYSTIHNYIACVLAFYKINDVALNVTKINRFIPPIRKVRKDRAYTHEEIRKILEIADERTRLMILLMCSSGMRVGALPILRIKHVEKNKITVYENDKEEYFTFITPECQKAIDGYLEFRKRYGEDLTSESWLIREQFNTTDSFRAKHPRQLTTAMTKGSLAFIEEKTGVRTKEVALAHGFRKFFTTQLIHSKVNPEIREMLLGHKIGLASAYYRPTEEEMYAEYEKAIDNLTIDPSQRLQKKIEDMQSDEDALMERIMQKMEAKMQNK